MLSPQTKQYTIAHTKNVFRQRDCSNSLLPTGALYVASDWMALRPCERWTCELLKQSWKMMMTARRQWVIEECNIGQADLYEHMHMNTVESYYRNTLPVNHLVSLTDCVWLREIERETETGSERGRTKKMKSCQQLTPNDVNPWIAKENETNEWKRRKNCEQLRNVILFHPFLPLKWIESFAVATTFSLECWARDSIFFSPHLLLVPCECGRVCVSLSVCIVFVLFAIRNMSACVPLRCCTLCVHRHTHA